MDLATLWKLIGLGLEVDFDKRTWSITAGPFKAAGIKFITLKALSDDPATIQRLLADLFVRRAVMWLDFRRERVEHCIESLKALQASTEAAAEELAISSKAQDKLLASMLRAWSSECKVASGRFEAALEDERDPINTGMDISARDEIVPALGEFRRNSLPTVKLLIELLPQADPVRTQSVQLVTRAEDELVQHYRIGIASLGSPDVEPDPST